MTAVADATLRLFAVFTKVQFYVDDLATFRPGVDDALRAALQGRWKADDVIRVWERRNKDFLLAMEGNGWFNLQSWHANVLAGKLADDSRPAYFELFSERELGTHGRHREWTRAYGEVKRLRDFLAHNMSLRAVPVNERLVVNWFHNTPFGEWMEQDPARLDIDFMLRALEVAEWMLDVVVWTTWRLGFNGNAVIRDTAGHPFSELNEPAFAPPHLLGVPQQQRR